MMENATAVSQLPPHLRLSSTVAVAIMQTILLALTKWSVIACPNTSQAIFAF